MKNCDFPVRYVSLPEGNMGMNQNLSFTIVLGKLKRPHCDLTGILVYEGNHPQVALIPLSEILI